MGENGAGKSTLMKILAGVHTELRRHESGRWPAAAFAGVRDAEERRHRHHPPGAQPRSGTERRRQHLPRPRDADRRHVWSTARRMAKAARAPAAPARHRDRSRTPRRDLRVGEQQLVEIAKALSVDARILIMDEPTSALSSAECETLFQIVRQLAATGVAIIYISHRIDEVMHLAGRVTVLRDGRHVLTAPIGELDEDAIISAMVGRDMRRSIAKRAAQAADRACGARA